MSEGPTGSDPGQRGSDLSDLRSRLAALHGSVERLGRDEEGAPPPGAGTRALPLRRPDPAGAPGARLRAAGAAARASPRPVPYAEAPAQPPRPSRSGATTPTRSRRRAAQQPEVDAYGYPVAPEPLPADPYQPAPAATNGQGEQEAGAAAIDANIAILDIGPFADLIELRHFEEAVARLEAVRDVRVRRFGHGRAIIELGLAGPYAIGRELLPARPPDAGRARARGRGHRRLHGCARPWSSPSSPSRARRSPRSRLTASPRAPRAPTTDEENV